jgi:hypothetical protein
LQLFKLIDCYLCRKTDVGRSNWFGCVWSFKIVRLGSRDNSIKVAFGRADKSGYCPLDGPTKAVRGDREEEVEGPRRVVNVNETIQTSTSANSIIKEEEKEGRKKMVSYEQRRTFGLSRATNRLTCEREREREMRRHLPLISSEVTLQCHSMEVFFVTFGRIVEGKKRRKQIRAKRADDNLGTIGAE